MWGSQPVPQYTVKCLQTIYCRHDQGHVCMHHVYKLNAHSTAQLTAKQPQRSTHQAPQGSLSEPSANCMHCLVARLNFCCQATTVILAL